MATIQWQHVGTCVDGGPLEIDGIDVWKYDWTPLANRTANVRDPAYGQPHEFQVYELTVENKSLLFAAGEFSNCVWGFYLLRLSS
jgi:hypothetical protein